VSLSSLIAAYFPFLLSPSSDEETYNETSAADSRQAFETQLEAV
jgi:hypothetical protein